MKSSEKVSHFTQPQEQIELWYVLCRFLLETDFYDVVFKLWLQVWEICRNFFSDGVECNEWGVKRGLETKL